jgi:hypothetical protein
MKMDGLTKVDEFMYPSECLTDFYDCRRPPTSSTPASLDVLAFVALRDEARS